MLRSIVMLLLAAIPFVGFAQTEQNFGLTVGKVAANSTVNPSYGVEFVEGNPLTGPEGCQNRFRYDKSDIALVALIMQSYVGAERMNFTLEDDNPTGRTPCTVKRVGTIN